MIISKKLSCNLSESRAECDSQWTGGEKWYDKIYCLNGYLYINGETRKWTPWKKNFCIVIMATETNLFICEDPHQSLQ
jgi:hypothetical protein